jgi:aspartyl-tRNA(Asn)/glutamyl-tRNA(Gln) amidotransferase subunit B
VTDWEVVIGLECHVQLATRSKLFSGSSTAFGGAPNSQTDPVVLGLPGALPVLNEQAVDHAIRLGLAVGGRIRPRSRFARKHYFYPDLPKGYQISQYDEPIVEGGVVELPGGRSVRLTRIHLEEDAGKNIHEPGQTISLVDLNRAGIPLCEVVSEPDIRSAEEAADYMRALRQLVVWLGISDGNMEAGSLRCDANVSLRPRGQAAYGTRTELKNINSFKFVQRAIEHEIARQAAILDGGGRLVQETRLWDADKGASAAMRTKEHAHDYRYFPDPDLPPVTVSDERLARARAALPELPGRARERLARDLGLTEADARVLTDERGLTVYFDAAVAAGADAKKVASWMQTELLRELNRLGRAVEESPVTAAGLAELVKLIDDGTISGKIAKDVFAKMVASSGDRRESARAIVEREGLIQVTDAGALETAAQAAIAQNPKQVEQYRGGQAKMLGFFVGQVMKATGGKANPALVNEILRRLLERS